MREFLQHYMRGLGTSARNNAMAYGYSITATASFAILSHTDGPITILKIAMFVTGTGLAFAGVNALVTRGFSRRVDPEPPVVMALATSLSLVSMSAAVAVAGVLGWGLGGWAAWLLGALLASWTYVSIGALEAALARTLHLAVGEKEPEHR
jgi:hypothetical protein